MRNALILKIFNIKDHIITKVIFGIVLILTYYNSLLSNTYTYIYKINISSRFLFIGALLPYICLCMVDTIISKVLTNQTRIEKIGDLGELMMKIGMYLYLPIYIFFQSLVFTHNINVFYNYDFNKLYSIGSILAPILSLVTIGFLYVNFISDSKKYKIQIEKQEEEKKDQIKKDDLTFWKDAVLQTIKVFISRLNNFTYHPKFNISSNHNDVFKLMTDELRYEIKLHDDKGYDFQYPMNSDQLQLFQDTVKVIKMLEECPEGKNNYAYNFIRNYFFVNLKQSFGLYIYTVCSFEDISCENLNDIDLLLEYFDDFANRMYTEMEREMDRTEYPVTE